MTLSMERWLRAHLGEAGLQEARERGWAFGWQIPEGDVLAYTEPFLILVCVSCNAFIKTYVQPGREKSVCYRQAINEQIGAWFENRGCSHLAGFSIFQEWPDIKRSG